ncbi:MAG TPA: dihydrodipicolinate reductase C-terminal domain-containing protein [Phycisphaerales bacterium]|nr:dihydrodipicolinate reductase C-terminal domain-containing protein [Phycisphaerales bacterium]
MSNHARVAIGLCGASGAMGSRILALAHADPRFELVSTLTRDGAGPSQAPRPADVVVDFSAPAGTRTALASALRTRSALLVGTTGLDEALHAALRDAAAHIPVLVAPNTSLGIAAVAAASAALARALGPGFHCSIVEAHHARKKDAPSGTALRLAHALRAAGAHLPDSQVLSIRGGDVVGEHTVRFAGPGECIEVVHRATTRDLFAAGALRAAAWLAGKPAGWYAIEDVMAG